MHSEVLLLVLLVSFALAASDIESDIKRLHKDLSKDYWSHSQKYRPIITW